MAKLKRKAKRRITIFFILLFLLVGYVGINYIFNNRTIFNIYNNLYIV